MSKVKEILSKVIEANHKLTVKEAEVLFNCNDESDLQEIKHSADYIRQNINGNKVSYIINLNTNFTNICESVCLFCGFRRSENQPESYILDLDDYEEVLANAVKDDITEVCLQGGLYSKLRIKGLNSTSLLDMYAELMMWIKDRHPDLHIHAYSPEEIDFLSILSGKPIKYVLEYLKDSGLGSMPGTAAEIFNEEIRLLI